MNKKKPIRKKSKFEKVEGILNAALRRRGLSEEILRYRFVNHWDVIVGKELAEICEPAGVKNGTLWVQVPSSTWANELSFQADTIIKRLNAYLPKEEQVTQLQFRVK